MDWLFRPPHFRGPKDESALAQKRPGGLQALIFDPPGIIVHLLLKMFDVFFVYVFLIRFVCVFPLRARLRARLFPG